MLSARDGIYYRPIFVADASENRDNRNDRQTLIAINEEHVLMEGINHADKR